MPVVSIVNHKGGCGKTTTAVNLSAALSANRKTVLLIDMDPQGHASLALGVNPDERPTMFDVLDTSAERALKDVVVRLSATFHLAPSNIWLSALEQKLAGKNGREYRLRLKLAKFAQRYDYVIIDCPPSLGLLTINALLCSDQLIIPVDTSVFSLHGIEKLRETIAMVRNKLGHDPEMFGLATIFDERTRFARAFLERIGEIFGRNLLPVIIPSTIKFREAAEHGRSILDHAPSSKGSEAFAQLAGVIIRRERKARAVSGQTLTAAPEKVREVTFCFPDTPGARTVQLAGDFNDWDPEESTLMKNGGGDWVAAFPLKSGSYQYKYVVDGEWVLDPRNGERIETAMGSVNSVITVE